MSWHRVRQCLWTGGWICACSDGGTVFTSTWEQISEHTRSTPTTDQDAADNSSDLDHHREQSETDLRDDGDIHFDRENEQ